MIAHITDMGDFFVLSVAIGLILLFFPIFLRADLFLHPFENKFTFSISLYGHLPILGGYLQIVKGGIAIHLSDTKAVFLPFGQIAATGKKFDFTKGFQLYRLHIITELGGQNSPYGIMGAAFARLIGELLLGRLKGTHPFLDAEHDTLIADRPTLKQTIKCTLIFNLLVLIVALTKKLLEALIIWMKKRKSTASWKRRHARSQA